MDNSFYANQPVADEELEDCNFTYLLALVIYKFQVMIYSRSHLNNDCNDVHGRTCAVLLKMIILGLGNIENSALQLVQQIKRHCDYCRDIKLYYRAQHQRARHQ